MPKERGETGQFIETVTLDDVLTVFDAVDGPPVVTSADVADATGVSRDSARRKLEELQERGEVDSRRTAGRVLYWRVDDVRDDGELRPLQESREPEPVTDTDLTGDGPTREDAREATGDVDDVVIRAVERVADGWDDAPDRLEARKAAAVAVLERALETGEPMGKSSETVEAIHEEHSVSGQNYETWWRKNVRPVLKKFGTYDRGAHGYRVDELGEEE